MDLVENHAAHVNSRYVISGDRIGLQHIAEAVSDVAWEIVHKITTQRGHRRSTLAATLNTADPDPDTDNPPHTSRPSILARMVAAFSGDGEAARTRRQEASAATALRSRLEVSLLRAFRALTFSLLYPKLLTATSLQFRADDDHLRVCCSALLACDSARKAAEMIGLPTHFCCDLRPEVTAPPIPPTATARGSTRAGHGPGRARSTVSAMTASRRRSKDSDGGMRDRGHAERGSGLGHGSLAGDSDVLSVQSGDTDVIGGTTVSGSFSSPHQRQRRGSIDSAHTSSSRQSSSNRPTVRGVGGRGSTQPAGRVGYTSPVLILRELGMAQSPLGKAQLLLSALTELQNAASAVRRYQQRQRRRRGVNFPACRDPFTSIDVVEVMRAHEAEAGQRRQTMTGGAVDGRGLGSEEDEESDDDPLTSDDLLPLAAWALLLASSTDRNEPTATPRGRTGGTSDSESSDGSDGVGSVWSQHQSNRNYRSARAVRGGWGRIYPALRQHPVAWVAQLNMLEVLLGAEEGDPLQCRMLFAVTTFRAACRVLYDAGRVCPTFSMHAAQATGQSPAAQRGGTASQRSSMSDGTDMLAFASVGSPHNDKLSAPVALSHGGTLNVPDGLSGRRHRSGGSALDDSSDSDDGDAAGYSGRTKRVHPPGMRRSSSATQGVWRPFKELMAEKKTAAQRSTSAASRACTDSNSKESKLAKRRFHEAQHARVAASRVDLALPADGPSFGIPSFADIKTEVERLDELRRAVERTLAEDR